MASKRKAARDVDQRRQASKTRKSDAQNPAISGSFDSYPTSLAYRLIEPGPVLLVSTGSLAQSTHNVMTIGFHMMMQHSAPCLIGITLGPWDASFDTLREQRECVLAVPSVEIAEQVVDIGNCSSSDSEVNKWERFGLEALPASRVQAPLVGGPHVIANIECVVEDTTMVDKYSMWVLRAVRSWINPRGGKMFHHRGQGIMVTEGDVLDLKDRMVKWQEFLD
ncbi:uncharacterized protein N7459_004113 [Penicillium hispanicum]|uniref:uncharacterized protein n=1 Tax=Penicillium hispanicum TaxID=1080232 RepID=UPI00253FCC7B|nr:uncharacterized protein N7459_004113 [Penicillium hispanicum]KAJ5584313.1 hypothetical protein N7459_004113 [Penicillium hispanicum]